MSDSEADDYNLRLTLSPPGRSNWYSSSPKEAGGDSGAGGGDVADRLFGADRLLPDAGGVNMNSNNEYADKRGSTFLPSSSDYVSIDHVTQQGYGRADSASAAFELGPRGSLSMAPNAAENLLGMNLCSGRAYWTGYGNVQEEQPTEGGRGGTSASSASMVIQYANINYDANFTGGEQGRNNSSSNEGGVGSRRATRTGDYSYGAASNNNRGVGGYNYKSSGKEVDQAVEESRAGSGGGGGASSNNHSFSGDNNNNNGNNNAAATMVMMMMGQKSGGGAKEERIAAPYAWAADRRAGVLSLEELRAKGIGRVWGEVVCRKCDGGGGGGGGGGSGGGSVGGNGRRMEVEVWERFVRVRDFFLANRARMHDRAPPAWYSPRLLDCPLCLHTDCLRPVVSPKKRSINWLFLLLTQTLGLCTLEQLKYFCKHNRKHRTGAKDRVLYLTYASLLKQLDPSAPYDL